MRIETLKKLAYDVDIDGVVISPQLTEKLSRELGNLIPGGEGDKTHLIRFILIQSQANYLHRQGQVSAAQQHQGMAENSYMKISASNRW